MGLDVRSERGLLSVKDEEEAVRIISAYMGADYVHTPKNEPADIDAVLVDGFKVIAVAETKCRYDMDLQMFQRVRKSEWLISADKLTKGCEIAKRIRVPFLGFLYLVQDRKVLAVRISDRNGDLLPPIRIERTETDATINQRKRIVRTNAFIDMRGCKIFEGGQL